MRTEENSDNPDNPKKVTGNEYLRFIIGGIEAETLQYRGDPDFEKKLRLMRSLKYSVNPLKDIFFISKIKKLELLAAYLLFVLKKIDENRITFENLVENYEADKENIKKELLAHVSLKEPEATEEPVRASRTLSREFTESLPQNETLQSEFLSGQEQEEEIPQESENIADKSGVEINDNTGEEENQVAKISGLQLVSHDEDERIEKDREVFDLPGSETAEEGASAIKEEIIPESKNITIDENNFSDVFESADNSTDDKPEATESTDLQNIDEQQTEEPQPDKENKETTQAKLQLKNKLKKLFKKPDRQKPGESEEQETTVFIKKPTEEIREEKHEEVKNEVPAADEEYKSGEEPKTANVVTNEEETPMTEEYTETTEYIKHEASEIKRIQINPITEQYQQAQEKINISAETAKEKDPEEIRFNEYVDNVKKTNEIIRSELNNLSEQYDKNSFNTIIKFSSYLKECSEEMSFEIITEIYYTLFIYFEYILKSDEIPGGYGEDVSLMIQSLSFTETFLEGNDFNGSEKLIKDIEAIKNRILSAKAERERLERLEKEKAELEKQLGEKFSDAEQRKKLLTLKSNILEVEAIFKSIDSIRGEFQTYEAFRILSQTYSIFKSIVTQANTLEIDKMASLAESSYIFLKYIQNYRMNPFSEEIKEVLKYIIVNFKLLFLGKPTKDLDVFISYLNNPEKIFTQKED
jgi:hypothetical protein